MIRGSDRAIHDKIPFCMNKNIFFLRESVNMALADRIEQKLQQEFTPAKLVVIDESHLHAGHAGARPQGESHFRVQIVAKAFAKANRVARQRMIYKLLEEELATDIHALALDVKAPGEE